MIIAVGSWLLSKLFWHIIPCDHECASFCWGVSMEDFSVPLCRVNARTLDNNNYWFYEGEILGQAALINYIFDNCGLKRVRVEFKWDTSVLLNRRQVVEKVFNGLCDICGAPVNSGLAAGHYSGQGLVNWNIEDTNLVLAISPNNVILNAFVLVKEQPTELNNDLVKLIDEMSQVFLQGEQHLRPSRRRAGIVRSRHPSA